MFNIWKAKEKIHDWAYNVADEEERTLEVVNEALEPLQNIIGLWKNDGSYQQADKDVTLYRGSFYKFGDALPVIHYCHSQNYLQEKKFLISKGYSGQEAHLILLKRYLLEHGYKIKNERDFEEFCTMYENLTRLLFIRKEIKKEIIQINALLIFINCQKLNLIRKNNGVYTEIIGHYEVVEKILGDHGEKISKADSTVLEYIAQLEELEEKLQMEKEILLMHKEGRKK